MKKTIEETKECPKCKTKLVYEEITVKAPSKQTIDRWVWVCPNCNGFLGCDGKIYDLYKKTTITLPPSVHLKLRKIADSENRTISNMVLCMILEYKVKK